MRRLAGHIAGVVLFDTDLFGPHSNPDSSAWASGWLLVAHAVHQSGPLPVLCGYGLRHSTVEALPARALLGPIHVLNLDLEPDDLRAGLGRRPGYDAGRIEQKMVAAIGLRSEADLNVGGAAEPEVVDEIVRAWLSRVSSG